MIPENKKAAVKKALQTAFSVDESEDIQQLTKGLSSALIYKIVVRESPYLLRIVTRSDALGDPSFYYGCMKVAAEHEVAPRIHYMGIEDRVSITDFVIERPFTLVEAKETMPSLIRKLHSLPKFPFRINYFETVENFFLPQFRSARILGENEIKELHEIYRRITSFYPINDSENWVSSHNDSKPENVVFDGRRPWFVDWEGAFLNDRYFDLSIVANFVVRNEKDEAVYLETYFEETVDEYKHARLFLMQQILHFSYFIFLLGFDTGEKPVDIGKINIRGFREFHDGMWNGAINLAHTDMKREYALLHLEQFKLKAQTKRFEESLRLVSKYHHSSR